jgi:hypothetical protein
MHAQREDRRGDLIPVIVDALVAGLLSSLATSARATIHRVVAARGGSRPRWCPGPAQARFRQSRPPLGRYHRAHDIEIQTVSTCQVELRCARTESGNAAVAPPMSVMNLRRFMPAPTLRRPHFNGSTDCLARASRHWSMSPLGQSHYSDCTPITSGLPR